MRGRRDPAARCTSGVAYSPPAGSAKPECSPIRTRGAVLGCGHGCAASSSWAWMQARIAPFASGKAAKTESPSVNSSDTVAQP